MPLTESSIRSAKPKDKRYMIRGAEQKPITHWYSSSCTKVERARAVMLYYQRLVLNWNYPV